MCHLILGIGNVMFSLLQAVEPAGRHSTVYDARSMVTFPDSGRHHLSGTELDCLLPGVYMCVWTLNNLPSHYIELNLRLVDCKSSALTIVTSSYTVFLLLYRDQRWLCTFSRDNWRSICSTSDVLQTEGTFTTAQHCCGIFVILAPDTKLQTYLHTYTLHTYIRDPYFGWLMICVVFCKSYEAVIVCGVLSDST